MGEAPVREVRAEKNCGELRADELRADELRRGACLQPDARVLDDDALGLVEAHRLGGEVVHVGLRLW